VTRSRRDRDSSIEQLMRDSLEARARHSSAGQCVEAEALAAWVDDRLARDERRRVEAHLSSCARCQAIVAAMARIDPAPARRPPWRVSTIVGWVAPVAAVTAALVWLVVPERAARQLPAPAAPSVAGAPAPGDVDLVREAAPPAALQKQAPPAARQFSAGARNKIEEGRTPASGAKKATPQAADALTETETGAISSTTARAATDLKQRPAPAAAQAAAATAPAGPVQIVSVGGASQWRIVDRRRIERSTDGGKSWQPQLVGATVLNAGAAPSASVCWVVGAAGTVLLTVDGVSWLRLSPPDAADLVSVAASNEKTATVTTADGRGFMTEDGGNTWSCRQLQDFPTAPFQG